MGLILPGKRYNLKNGVRHRTNKKTAPEGAV
jgi:hypothetical protein